VAKSAGAKIVKGEKKEGYDWMEDVEYIFSEKGMILFEILRRKHDKDPDTIYYSYNKSGKLGHTFYRDDLINEFTSYYKYDKNGKLIRIHHSSGDETFVYGTDGRVKTKYRLMEDGTKEFREDYTYDRNGFLKKEDVYYYLADWHIIHEFENDEDGNILKYKFDSSIEELQKSYTHRFEYDWDKKGNWIKKTLFAYGEPRFIVERTIVYN
jgi:YD repeat-containing protein